MSQLEKEISNPRVVDSDSLPGQNHMYIDETAERSYGEPILHCLSRQPLTSSSPETRFSPPPIPFLDVLLQLPRPIQPRKREDGQVRCRHAFQGQRVLFTPVAFLRS